MRAPLDLLTRLIEAQIASGRGLCPDAAALAGELASVLDSPPEAPTAPARKRPPPAVASKAAPGRWGAWLAAVRMTPEGRRCLGSRSKYRETLEAMPGPAFDELLRRESASADAWRAAQRARFEEETAAAARAWLAMSPADRDARRAGEGTGWESADARRAQRTRPPANPTPDAGVSPGRAARAA